MHILVVDDAADICEILDIVLSGDGWTVSTATSLSQADSLLLQLQATDRLPQLILVDFQLPDGDGVSAARRWKSQPALSDTPIVLYTGSARTADPLLADVIVKSIDPFQLSQRLRRILAS